VVAAIMTSMGGDGKIQALGKISALLSAKDAAWPRRSGCSQQSPILQTTLLISADGQKNLPLEVLIGQLVRHLHRSLTCVIDTRQPGAWTEPADCAQILTGGVLLSRRRP
jgi:hypothetical protein